MNLRLYVRAINKNIFDRCLSLSSLKNIYYSFISPFYKRKKLTKIVENVKSKLEKKQSIVKTSLNITNSQEINYVR